MAQPQTKLTPEQYLAFERASDTRHEYLNGEIFEMVGASRTHNLIVTNTISTLRPQLRGSGCRVYANDLRIKVSSACYYTYPDIIIVCGEEKFEDAAVDTLLNPTVIMEVLSRSTELYDRGKKFELYAKLDSLVDYVLITQNRPRIEHFLRQADGSWRYTDHAGVDAALTLSNGSNVLLRMVYEEIDFTVMDD